MAERQTLTLPFAPRPWQRTLMDDPAPQVANHGTFGLYDTVWTQKKSGGGIKRAMPLMLSGSGPLHGSAIPTT